MSDVKIKVIDSDKLINAINEGSYDVNLSAVMALGAVMPETEKQKICEYCHEDSDGHVTPLEKNCHAFIRFGMNGWCLNLQVNKWHREVDEVEINYCPMCGRKLNRFYMDV